MDKLLRFEFLDSRVWLHVWTGLTALATKHYLNWQFYALPVEQREIVFATHVANNFLYRSNEALIQRSIVGLVETIKEQERRDPVHIHFPDLKELRKHRIILSHPANIAFDDPQVQEFYDKDMHYKDRIAVRLWRTREVLLDKLTSLGSAKARQFPNKVTVQNGTIELIQGAINVSLQVGQPPRSARELHESVPIYFEKFDASIRRLAAE